MAKRWEGPGLGPWGGVDTYIHTCRSRDGSGITFVRLGELFAVRLGSESLCRKNVWVEPWRSFGVCFRAEGIAGGEVW